MAEVASDILFNVWDFVRGPVVFLLVLLLLVFIKDRLRDNEGCGSILVLALLLAGGGWLFRSCQEHRIANKTEELGGNLQEYAAMSELPLGNDPLYIRGRVVAVDPDGGLSPFHLELPKDLRAKDRDEIETALIVKYWVEVVGHYRPGGGEAQLQWCSIDFIDVKMKKRVGAKVFRGTNPPESKAAGGDAAGSSPDREALKFIKSLPHR